MYLTDARDRHACLLCSRLNLRCTLRRGRENQLVIVTACQRQFTLQGDWQLTEHLAARHGVDVQCGTQVRAPKDVFQVAQQTV